MNKTLIHPTAIIEDGASIAKDVSIGPYCHIGKEVTIAEGSVLHAHVVVAGNTSIGKKCRIFPFSSLGHIPQDLKYGGEPSRLEIGDNNTIREHVTMNPGTEGGGLVTRVGSDCLFMVGSHVAHDCIVGDHIILANNATLGGHVLVEDYAIIGGLSAVHQFVRIGHHAMIGGMSGIEHDVIPYGLAMGERAVLSGLNLVGLKRGGFAREDINTLRSAYRLLFSPEGTLNERIEDAADRYKNNVGVDDVIKFMRVQSQRSLCQPDNTKQKDAAIG